MLDWQDTGAIDPYRPIPLDDEYPNVVMQGDDRRRRDNPRG